MLNWLSTKIRVNNPNKYRIENPNNRRALLTVTGLRAKSIVKNKYASPRASDIASNGIPSNPCQYMAAVAGSNAALYNNMRTLVGRVPPTTGSMGMFARLYSFARTNASAQKCGGCQRKMIKNSKIAGQVISLVTAVQPITGGSAPARCNNLCSGRRVSPPALEDHSSADHRRGEAALRDQ